MRYRKRLLDLDLTPAQRAFVDAKIRTLRIEFADDILHRLSHRNPPPLEVMRAQLKLDPMTLMTLPIHAGQIVAQRIKGAATR
jgi:hypothetical protein